MRVEMRPLDEVRPYERNPRSMGDAAERLAELIREYGFRVPILVDRDGVIIAGHTRLEAARRLGLAEVPVVVAEDLSPEQARALRIADNAAAGWTSWDLERLAAEIQELDLAGIDLAITGLDEAMLEELMIPEPELIDAVGNPRGDDRRDCATPGRSHSVVSVGRLSALVDYDLAAELARKIAERHGDDPAEAIPAWCRALVEQGW